MLPVSRNVYRYLLQNLKLQAYIDFLYDQPLFVGKKYCEELQKENISVCFFSGL